MAALPVRRSGRNTSLVNPSREFEDIYDRMGQLMNFAFGDMARVEMPWVPLADLSETDEAYLAEDELPGVAKDDISVEPTGQELVISGEFKDTQQADRALRRGRRSGRFEYRVLLPGHAEAGKVTAALADGVLMVTVPKAETEKPRRIQITGG